jgi:hypothetical protein
MAENKKRSRSVPKEEIQVKRRKLTEELVSLESSKQEIVKRIKSTTKQLAEIQEETLKMTLAGDIATIIDKCQKNPKLVIVLNPFVVNELDQSDKKQLSDVFPKFICGKYIFDVQKDTLQSDDPYDMNDDDIRCVGTDHCRLTDIDEDGHISPEDVRRWKEAGRTIDGTHLDGMNPESLELQHTMGIESDASDTGFAVEIGLVVLCSDSDFYKDYQWEWSDIGDILEVNPF